MEPIKVLIVDDNTHHGSGLAELLELSGFKAWHASTGAECLELVGSLTFDAVLLDIGLPDMSGVDVLRALRAKPNTKTVAIIFHTGSHTKPQEIDGYDAFLTYPVDVRDLIIVIRGAVQRRRKRGLSTNATTA